MCSILTSGEVSREVYEQAIRCLIQEAQEVIHQYHLFEPSSSFCGRKDEEGILRICLVDPGDLPSHSVQTANPVGCKGGL